MIDIPKTLEKHLSVIKIEIAKDSDRMDHKIILDSCHTMKTTITLLESMAKLYEKGEGDS